MRKIVLTLILMILFLLFGTSAAVLALVEAHPFHPGESMFGLQNSLAHALGVFYFAPASQANFELDLLDQRVGDLNASAGQADEVFAIAAVLGEIDHVVARFQNLPDGEDATQRERFVKALDTIQTLVPQLSATAGAYPREFAIFQAKIAGLKFLALDTTQPLNRLYGLTHQPNPVVERANAAATAAATPLATLPGHGVPFLPGSAGAAHAFFPLTGKHAQLVCQDCHSGLTYAGTPNQCATCHANAKPANHFAGQCSACHTTSAWRPASFNHAAVNASDCAGCHNANKPANHFAGQCSACHTTSAWRPASFNHAAVNASDCVGCHNANKPANHFAGQCSACHTTSAWLPARFDHAAAGATDCVGCHSANKPANHFAGQCSACHTTSAWLPARFDHAAAGATDCVGCHSANKPANHFDGQCSNCHSTSAWQPASFSHRFPLNHGNANSVCATCHPSGTDSFTCFNCHNESELTRKHAEEGIPDFVVRCMDCHSDGRKHDN